MDNSYLINLYYYLRYTLHYGLQSNKKKIYII